METILNRIIWGNSVLAYLAAILGIVAVWILVQLIRQRVLAYIRKAVDKTNTTLDDLVVSLAERFVIPYSYLAINYHIITSLNMSATAAKIASAAMMVITAWYIAKLVNFVVHRSIVLFMKRRNEPGERIQQVAGMLMVVKAFVWITAIIMLADNLGYDVTTVIAGLGVGGIAIALAAQSILSDLFSYIVIFFDKPFEIGDFIVMDSYSGVVEKIGIKTTHLRSLDGQQLIMPNAEMAKAVIQNFKRLQRRRVIFKIGVEYGTTRQQLQEIPELIKSIVSGQDTVDFDRSHLKGFGDYSIDFETVYYINSAEYGLYMSIQQDICLKLYEAFENEGIAFAFPTQTLFVKSPETAGNNRMQVFGHGAHNGMEG